MANDDDVVFVDVVPRLDEGAAEKETGKLRDKLKNAGKGLGKAIGSDVTREIGETLWEAGGEEVKKAGVRWGHDLTTSLGNAIGGPLGDIAKSVGDSLLESGAESISDSISKKLKGVKDAADDVKKSFADIKKGNYGDVLKKIDENADKLPDPLRKAHEQLDPIGRAFGEIKETGKDVIDIFAGLEVISPRLASGLLAVAGPLGEIAGSMAMVPKIDDWLKHLPGDLGKGFNDLLPDTSNWNWLMAPFRMMGGDLAHPSRLGQGGLYDPKTGNYIGPGATPSSPQPRTWWPVGAMPGHGGNFLPSLPSAIAGGTTGSGGIPSIAPPDTGGLPSLAPTNIGGAVAHPSGFIPGGASYGLPPGANSGGYGGGGVQFPAWVNQIATAFGIKPSTYPGHQETDRHEAGYAPNPQHLNRAIDWSGPTPNLQRFAEYLASIPQDLEQVIWQNPNTGQQIGIAGGHSAPPGYYAGDFPEHTNHVHTRQSMPIPLPGGRGGIQASLSDFTMPVGAGTPLMPSLGGYAPPPTQANQGGGAVQQQQLGHGSGVGVGGGIIGLAEQAGAMAAGAFSFGGGAIAAQIAEQEINLAVQKGGQMAAVGAMAPFETFGLHGGQMGAPSVSPGGGWIGKILGGMIGQQFSSPNIAGATQSPKQPQEQQTSQSGQQGGGGQGGSGGPQGTKDDPLHVKSVSPAQGPQQGTATSALSGIGYMSPLTV